MVTIIKASFLDDHRILNPFYILQNVGESEREFNSRAWRKYSELCREYETAGNGNHVYMKKDTYTFDSFYQGMSGWIVCKNGEHINNYFCYENIANVTGMSIEELKERNV